VTAPAHKPTPRQIEADSLAIKRAMAQWEKEHPVADQPWWMKHPAPIVLLCLVPVIMATAVADLGKNGWMLAVVIVLTLLVCVDAPLLMPPGQLSKPGWRFTYYAEIVIAWSLSFLLANAVHDVPGAAIIVGWPALLFMLVLGGILSKVNQRRAQYATEASFGSPLLPLLAESAPSSAAPEDPDEPESSPPESEHQKETHA